MINIAPTNISCGIAQLHGLSGIYSQEAINKMGEFDEDESEYKPKSKDVDMDSVISDLARFWPFQSKTRLPDQAPAQVIFSDSLESKTNTYCNGRNLATSIQANNLGSVVSTGEPVHNPRSANHIRTWIWTLSPKARDLYTKYYKDLLKKSLIKTPDFTF